MIRFTHGNRRLVRLDDETQRALSTLESSGFSRSEAIREAILMSAAALRRKKPLREEMAALERTRTTAARLDLRRSWDRSVQRGDIYELRVPKGVGHEQHGRRFGVIVQSDAPLPRSVVLLAPTSTGARPASIRPEIAVLGTTTPCSSSRWCG